MRHSGGQAAATALHVHARSVDLRVADVGWVDELSQGSSRPGGASEPDSRGLGCRPSSGCRGGDARRRDESPSAAE